MKKILLLSLAALAFTFTTTLPVIIKSNLPNGGICYHDTDSKISANLYQSGEYYATQTRGETESRGELFSEFDSADSRILFNELKSQYNAQEAAKKAS